MKIGTYKLIPLSVLLICIGLVVMSGCRSDQEPAMESNGSDGSSAGGVAVPHGYMARLEQVHDGRRIGFSLCTWGIGKLWRHDNDEKNN